MTRRPNPDEHKPYFSRYIDQVPDGDVFRILAEQHAQLRRMLGSLNEEQARHRYAADKWSVIEVVGHMTDTERVFAYRALRFARGDRTPLPGYDENEYVPAARFERRSLGGVLDEFSAVRQATLALFRSFDDRELDAGGVGGDGHVTVRALLFIITGHERHHMNLFHTRYGIPLAA